MDLGVQIGLLLALATAFTSVLGFLLKHRGAVQAPRVEWRRPWASSVALLTNRAFAIGMAVAMGSWGFHVAALALAPISLVQSVIAGGLVMLTVCAERLFDIPVSRREWIGVAVAAAGLAFLAATLEGAADEAHADWTAARLLPYVGALTLAGVLLVPAAGRSRTRGGVLLGASAGALWGASDVSIKALSANLEADGWLVWVHPLAAVILVLSLAGLLVSARSLQDGEAVPVIAVTSAVANCVTIASGPIVFAEPLPDEPLALGVRILAFALVVAAAALTPGPVKAPEPAAAP